MEWGRMEQGSNGSKGGWIKPEKVGIGGPSMHHIQTFSWGPILLHRSLWAYASIITDAGRRGSVVAAGAYTWETSSS